MGLVHSPDRIDAKPIAHEYTITIHEDITSPNMFKDELDLLNRAGPHDLIIIDICTDGGDLDTALLFQRAIRGCQARTIAVIGPTCASAGSVIALACEEWVICDTSSMMIHTGSYGIMGKDTDILEHAVFTRKLLHKVNDLAYTGFLDEEELADVIKGTPFYFLGDELGERLMRLHQYREEQEQKAEQEFQAMPDEPETVELEVAEKPKRKTSSRKHKPKEDSDE